MNTDEDDATAQENESKASQGCRFSGTMGK
jgi:hypothetical protein